MNESLTIQLPTPPSIWRLYVGQGKRRTKSSIYRAWIKEAGFALMSQRKAHKSIDCDVAVSIRAVKPKGKRRRDIDNLIKAPLDLLTSTQTIMDDSQVVELDVRWVDSGADFEMTVRAA